MELASLQARVTNVSKADVLWTLGVVVAILAQFISNLGTILQKRSHNDEALLPQAAQRPYTARPLWWVGMSFILTGSVADFVALTLAPQSVVATLGCLTLVAQVVWAPLILGERLSVRHWIATALIILGVVLAVVYGPHTDGHYALPELLGRFSTLGFAIYVLLAIGVALALYGAISYVEGRFDLPPKPMLGDYYTEDGRKAGDQRWGRFHRVAYGMLSGVIGAQVVLLGKFIGELIAITITGNTATFTTPATYIIIITLAGAVVGQIHFMNEGVSRFQSLYVLPTFQASWTLTCVVGGLVVFDEWSSLSKSVTRQVVFPLGIFITLFAVYYLMNTPALPEDIKRRSACFDRLIGGPGVAGDGPGGKGAGGGAGGSSSGAEAAHRGDGRGGSADDENPDASARLTGSGGAGDGHDSDVRRRTAGGGLNGVDAVGSAGAAGDKGGWSRTCTEIWALEVPEEPEAAPWAARRQETRRARAAAAAAAGSTPSAAGSASASAAASGVSSRFSPTSSGAAAPAVGVSTAGRADGSPLLSAGGGAAAPSQHTQQPPRASSSWPAGPAAQAAQSAHDRQRLASDPLGAASYGDTSSAYLSEEVVWGDETAGLSPASGAGSAGRPHVTAAGHEPMWSSPVQQGQAPAVGR
jgi:hypothetical protein